MKIKSFTTPKKNKEIFIEPAYEDIPGLIDLNKERFQSYDFNINSIPYTTYREQVRSETLKKAGEYTDKIRSLCSKLNISGTETLSCIKDSYTPEKDIIQTGHSPALAHPGVLIKHSLASSIAKKMNGIGLNMVVDNDSVEYSYFKEFREDFSHLKPFRTEWMVWDEGLKLAGSIDMIFENPL